MFLGRCFVGVTAYPLYNFSRNAHLVQVSSVTLARIGDVPRAQALAELLEKQFPANTGPPKACTSRVGAIVSPTFASCRARSALPNSASRRAEFNCHSAAVSFQFGTSGCSQLLLAAHYPRYIEIRRTNPAHALQILERAAPYDLAFPPPQFEEGGLLYPAYVRGQAYLLHS